MGRSGRDGRDGGDGREDTPPIQTKQDGSEHLSLPVSIPKRIPRESSGPHPWAAAPFCLWTLGFPALSRWRTAVAMRKVILDLYVAPILAAMVAGTVGLVDGCWLVFAHAMQDALATHVQQPRDWSAVRSDRDVVLWVSQHTGLSVSVGDLDACDPSFPQGLEAAAAAAAAPSAPPPPPTPSPSDKGDACLPHEHHHQVRTAHEITVSTRRACSGFPCERLPWKDCVQALRGYCAPGATAQPAWIRHVGVAHADLGAAMDDGVAVCVQGSQDRAWLVVGSARVPLSKLRARPA